MKQLKPFILLLLIASGMITACKKRNNTDVAPVSLTVKLSFDTENTAYGFTFEKATVKATNTVTKQEYNANATADGTVTFASVAPGTYDITSTYTITAAEFNAKAGTNVQEAVVYNATLNTQAVVSNGQIALTLKTGRIGDFVIKQVYYAGSNTTNGALFRDQFIEIYNNSSETLYADSLYVGQIMGNAGVATAADQSKGIFQASGQYDWSKSVGNNKTDANTGYIYAKTIFMIRGTGKQYPVLPGKSIIIAATALNHKAPYTNISGTAVTVKDPTLTVDLSAADFEVYLGDQAGINPYPTDLDMPNVPNLGVIFNNGNRELIIDNLGRDGVFIFKSNVDPKTFDKYATPDVTQITSSSTLYPQVPLKYVIDGISLQHAVTASRVARRTPDVIDAGETFVPGGSYSSQSVVRKIGKTVNGRVVLKDTNNSTNDFGYLDRADPSKGATSFIN